MITSASFNESPSKIEDSLGMQDVNILFSTVTSSSCDIANYGMLLAHYEKMNAVLPFKAHYSGIMVLLAIEKFL